jgi:hypothetical protein
MHVAGPPLRRKGGPALDFRNNRDPKIFDILSGRCRPLITSADTSGSNENLIENAVVLVHNVGPDSHSSSFR